MNQAEILGGGKSAPKKHTQAIIACSDPELEQTLINVLSEFWIRPVLSGSLDDIRDLLSKDETVMAFSQAKFGECGFQDVLNAADISKARVPVVVCSEFYDKDLYIHAMSLGAFDYLAFPYSRKEVEWIINNALNWGLLQLEARGHSAA